MEIRTGILTIKPQCAFFSLSDYPDKIQPFIIFDLGNQRMGTFTNKAIGKNPTWTDNLQFIVHGSETNINA